MPTQTEYALMSANVYGNYLDTNGTNPVRSGNNNLPVPTGWTQIGTPDYKQNTPETGFMANLEYMIFSANVHGNSTDLKNGKPSNV